MCDSPVIPVPLMPARQAECRESADAARQRRWERLQKVLACPACGGELDFACSAACCRGCNSSYPVRNGRVYFVDVPARSDELDGIKGRLKRWLGDWYYHLGVNVIAPTYPFNYRRHIREQVDPDRRMVVDLGCGNHRIDPDIIGVDVFDYDAADVVCDVTRLPFKPGSVDAFASRSVLEHLPEVNATVEQIRRCTRPGGLSVHLVPFMYPYHASPHDYQRFTHTGLQSLFAGFTIQHCTNATGPVTLLLSCLIEALSIILSGGSRRLQACAYLLLCGLLFPIKYLDAVFINRPAFMSLAPSVFIVARKEDN